MPKTLDKCKDLLYNGSVTTNRDKTKQRKISALQLRLDGLTYAEIGTKLNVSRQRIQQYLSPPPKIRDLVRKRYNDKCEDCGVLVGVHGHIHHEGNGIETYTDIDNLHLLCLSCHRKRHGTFPSPEWMAERNKNIRNLYATGKYSYRQLARLKHLSHSMIGFIINNKTLE